MVVGASNATTLTRPLPPACLTPLAAPMAENRLAPNTPARSELRARTDCNWLAALLASSSLNWVASTVMPECCFISFLKPSSRWSVVETPGFTFDTYTLPLSPIDLASARAAIWPPIRLSEATYDSGKSALPAPVW